MSVQDGKVLYYTKGIYQKVINFPEKAIACQYCSYMRYRLVRSKRRYICSITYEPLVNVDITIGADCPLEFRKDE